MCPDSVVGELEPASEFLNRTRAAPQKGNDLTARALEKAFIQEHLFTVSASSGVSKCTRFSREQQISQVTA
jgi:hypothetical protein